MTRVWLGEARGAATLAIIESVAIVIADYAFRVRSPFALRHRDSIEFRPIGKVGLDPVTCVPKESVRKERMKRKSRTVRHFGRNRDREEAGELLVSLTVPKCTAKSIPAPR